MNGTELAVQNRGQNIKNSIWIQDVAWWYKYEYCDMSIVWLFSSSAVLVKKKKSSWGHGCHVDMSRKFHALGNI